MKFCKTLDREAQDLPEQLRVFINYKLLKKIIKEVATPLAGTDQHPSQQQDQSLVEVLRADVQRLNNFFIGQEEDAIIKIEALADQVSKAKADLAMRRPGGADVAAGPAPGAGFGARPETPASLADGEACTSLGGEEAGVSASAGSSQPQASNAGWCEQGMGQLPSKRQQRVEHARGQGCKSAVETERQLWPGHQPPSGLGQRCEVQQQGAETQGWVHQQVTDSSRTLEQRAEADRVDLPRRASEGSPQQLAHGAAARKRIGRNALSASGWSMDPQGAERWRVRLSDIKQQLVDFHGQMVMLNHWSSLNYNGVLKILKKYDKHAHGSLRGAYQQLLKQQPFVQTERVSEFARRADTLAQETAALAAAVPSHRSPQVSDKPDMARLVVRALDTWRHLAASAATPSTILLAPGMGHQRMVPSSAGAHTAQAPGQPAPAVAPLEAGLSAASPPRNSQLGALPIISKSRKCHLRRVGAAIVSPVATGRSGQPPRSPQASRS